MIIAFHFYLVSPEKSLAFESMFCDRIGIYRELLRQLQPSMIGLELLRSLELKTAYVTQEFWLNEDAYRRAQTAPAQSVLRRFLRNMSISCFDVGPCTFRPRIHGDKLWEEVSTESVADLVKERGYEDA